MFTRSKAIIYKPKIFMLLMFVTEPNNVKEELSNSDLKKSMQDKYDALVQNNM